MYAAGENEQEYCWLLRRTDALSEYFRQMSKAAEVTYDETDSAARQIRRLLEAHQNTMRHLRLLASD
ncbi:MAG: hypothetical protein IJG45_02850 [Oscillospiraceae bacterium]|nr:hypothetical protein [Oscillospiraceae bacterium]